MRNAVIVLAAFAAAALAGPASAANLLTDGFEAETYNLTQTALTNFTATTGNVDVVGPTYYGIACNGGSKCIDLDGTDTGGPTKLTSNASYAFAAGDTVTFSFDLSGNQRPGADSGTDDFTAGFVFASSTLLSNYGYNYGTAFNFAPGLVGAFSVTSSVNTSTPFSTRSIFFTAAQPGSLTFSIGTSSADNYGPILDNVSLDLSGAVPEPASWAMMIGGFGLIGGTMRRRARHATTRALA